MARIPVEKRDAGFPWWGWILALVIAVGAIWLIAELLDNDAEVEPMETAAVLQIDGADLDLEPPLTVASLESIRGTSLISQPSIL